MMFNRWAALRIAAGALLAFGSGVCRAQSTTPGSFYSMPSWNEKIPCDTAADCRRFLVLSHWGGAAVLDKETGLLWERTPSTSLVTWHQAEMGCNRRIVGGRMGWRLPTVQELSRLANGIATQHSVVVLPGGHPFQLSRYVYWTTTLSAANPSPQFPAEAWLVAFFSSVPWTEPTSALKGAWCVRGGQEPAVQ